MARPSIDVVVPPDVKEMLETIAKEQQSDSAQRVYASDVVRQAIQEFLNSRGIDMRVVVDRGGWRGEPKDKPAAE